MLERSGILTENKFSFLTPFEYLGKERNDLTKEDVVKFIYDNRIELMNFRFVAGDGRLKTFSFVTHNKKHIDRVLSAGERVDGSSVFPGMDPGRSDLYVVPRLNRIWVNPFAPVPTVDVLCSFFNHQGEPLPHAPDQVVRRAHDALTRTTGLTMEALAELEYYVISDPQPLYPANPQRGYGESGPFNRWEQMRMEAMAILGRMGYNIKYGHGEVGHVPDKDSEFEQHEIEFALMSPEDSADSIVVARWVLRMLSRRYNAKVTFAPKLVHGHAGSGMHIHARLLKDGRSVMTEKGQLTDSAHKMIAGYLELAPPLSAFGNQVPTSYLRLVPNQEAPVYVCWGDRNRSALIRVPLGWNNVPNMIGILNPQDPAARTPSEDIQTVELRSPDGSADSHLIHAGLLVAARHGFEKNDALQFAKDRYVDTNIFKAGSEGVRARLAQLPACCADSADSLLSFREVFQAQGVFAPYMVDGVANRLKACKDREMNIRELPPDAMEALIRESLHCA